MTHWRLALIGLVCVGAALPVAGSPQDEETPRAGEAFRGTLFGRPIDVAARDRRSITSLTAELLSAPAGPEDHRTEPAGALFLWRNRLDGHEVLRAEIAVFANEVRWSRVLAPEGRGIEVVLGFENVTLPWSSSEAIEGRRDPSGELKPLSVRTGAGAGYRTAIGRRLQDNFFEASLTYEPAYLFFARGRDAAESFVLPRDTYEGREHVRVRADDFERNLLELPHAGWGAGLDATAGQRARWKDWGGDAFGVQRGADSRTWSSLSGYAVAATGVPGTAGERHRFVFAGYAGRGWNVDRFSAFRLDGFSNWGDWETLSHPVLPGAAAGEFFTSRYGIASVEYRYQALFFLFLQARGTAAWLERPRRTASGSLEERTEPLHAVTAALTSGLLWNLSAELSWSHNFGVLRDRAGAPAKGRNALFLSLTKVFATRR